MCKKTKRSTDMPEPFKVRRKKAKGKSPNRSSPLRPSAVRLLPFAFDLLPLTCSPEPEQVVSRIPFVEAVPQQDAACEVRTRHAVARVTEGEKMSRIVAVRTDVRQAILRPRVRRVPPGCREDAGNFRVERRQLVHQLAGALDVDLLAQTLRWRLPIRPHHEQPLIVDPPNDVRRVG